MLEQRYARLVGTLGAVALMLTVVMTVSATRTDAFEIVNDTLQTIKIEQTEGQTEGKGLNRLLPPKTTLACRWNDADYNKEQRQKAVVAFTISFHMDRAPDTVLCTNKRIEADGVLTVTGTDPFIDCLRSSK